MMSNINFMAELNAKENEAKLACPLTTTELLNIIRPYVDGFLVDNKPIKDFTLFLSLEDKSNIIKSYCTGRDTSEGRVLQLDQCQTTAIFNAIKEVVQFPGLAQELRVEIPMDGSLPKFECAFYGKPAQNLNAEGPIAEGIYVLRVPQTSDAHINEIKARWHEVQEKSGHKPILMVVPKDMDFTQFKELSFPMAMKVMQAGRWVKRPCRNYKLTIKDGKLVLVFDDSTDEHVMQWLCTEDIIANDYVVV